MTKITVHHTLDLKNHILYLREYIYIQQFRFSPELSQIPKITSYSFVNWGVKIYSDY